MNEQLIIRLPAESHRKVAWLIVNDEKHVIASGELAQASELESLAERAKNRIVLVFVASSAVVFHSLELPGKSRRQAAQVVPFALEDEVAQDIDSLHFAWNELSPATAPLPVCVVAKAQLAFWLDALKTAGLPVTALYPDVFMLPYKANTWCVAQFEDEIVVRQSLSSGVVIEPEWLGYAAFEENELPTQLLAYGEVEWPHPPAPVQASDYDLALLAATECNTRQGINLLQGEFAQKQQNKTDRSVLKWPAVAAAVLVVMAMAGQFVTQLQLNREAAALQAAVEANYLTVFPTETRMPPNARQRLDAELAAVTGGGDGQLLALLNDLAPAFQEASLQLIVLQYDQSRGELRMQANGDNFQMFERFQRSARASQLEVEQGQLISRGGRIAGTLTVRRGS